MTKRTHAAGTGLMPVGLAGLLMLAALPAPLTAASSRAEMAAAGGRVLWHTPLSLRSVDSITSYHLVDEYVYAIGSDGLVRAVRADTGEHAWTQRLADPRDHLWPPVACHVEGIDAVAFTGPDEVVFLNPATGRNINEPARVGADAEEAGTTKIRGQLRLRRPATAQPAIAGNRLIASAAGRRIQAYGLSNGVPDWQLQTLGMLHIPPLYLGDRNQLILADDRGLVAGLDATIRERHFARQLRGEAVGGLAADERAVYVATPEPRLYALSRDKGETLMEYQLPARPRGGPVLAGGNLYQALTGGGILRISTEAKSKSWIVPAAERFLAGWGNRAALLRGDGKIVFVDLQTGQPKSIVDPGDAATGISNIVNDAIIVASDRGEITCIRPLGAKRLAAADFRPAPLAPPKAEGESTEATEEEPQPEEAVEVAEETATGPQLTLEEQILADPLRSRKTSEP